jgi:RNA polymerase sigma-70 factor (ECF subfamily)
MTNDKGPMTTTKHETRRNTISLLQDSCFLFPPVKAGNILANRRLYNGDEIHRFALNESSTSHTHFREQGKRVDGATIEKAKLGSRDAQAILLRSLQDVWFRVAVSLLRNQDLAQDAVQESALRFLKALPSFRGESQLQTWSLGIVVNVARELRRKTRDPSDVPHLRLAAAQSRASASDAGAMVSEEAQKLRDALGTLPERQREAIVLRFFEDLSVEETARAMDCAQGTVKATVHQAMRTLKEKLKQLV